MPLQHLEAAEALVHALGPDHRLGSRCSPHAGRLAGATVGRSDVGPREHAAARSGVGGSSRVAPRP